MLKCCSISLHQNKMPAMAIDICSEAHQRDPRNINILRDRAEAFILNQDYEKGTFTILLL